MPGVFLQHAACKAGKSKSFRRRQCHKTSPFVAGLHELNLRAHAHAMQDASFAHRVRIQTGLWGFEHGVFSSEPPPSRLRHSKILGPMGGEVLWSENR